MKSISDNRSSRMAADPLLRSQFSWCDVNNRERVGRLTTVSFLNAHVYSTMEQFYSMWCILWPLSSMFVKLSRQHKFTKLVFQFSEGSTNIV